MKYCFAAERTLGKLARWLRLLGYDTVFELDIGTGRFIDELSPEQILLTRTEKVRDIFSSQRLIFIESNDFEDQLRQIIRELGIVPKDIKPFTRCLECNVTLKEVPKNEISGQVPDYIWETNDVFQKCPSCKRPYWPGSHTKRSIQRIEELFR